MGFLSEKAQVKEEQPGLSLLSTSSPILVKLVRFLGLHPIPSHQLKSAQRLKNCGGQAKSDRASLLQKARVKRNRKKKDLKEVQNACGETH